MTYFSASFWQLASNLAVTGQNFGRTLFCRAIASFCDDTAVAEAVENLKLV